jgi:hypothetical protein
VVEKVDPVEPAGDGSATNDVVEDARRRRVRPPVFVVGLVVVALVAFLIGDAIFSSDGASSPEDAVQRLADAVTSEDMVGALSAMAPDEVRAIAGTYTAASDKAKALGVTGNGTFSWVDLKIEGLQLKTQQLGPDVARVSITGGKLTSKLHTDQLGSEATRLGGSGLQKAGKTSAKTVEASDLKWRPSGDHGAKRDPFLVAVRRDGSWYVSPFYTAAEYLMANAKPDVPRPNYSSIAPGPAAPTPSAAVQQLVSAINDRNVAHGIDSLSAGEWAVLRTYRGAIEQGIGDAVKDASDDGFHIDDIQFKQQKVDDTHTLVKIASFKAHLQGTDDVIQTLGDQGGGSSSSVSNSSDVTSNDTSTDGSQTDPTSTDQTDSAPKVRLDIGFDGDCLTVSSPDDHFNSCDQSQSAGFDSGIAGFDASLGIVSRIEKRLTDSFGIMTVAERGGWSVSPMDTVFGALTNVIKGLTPDDLVALTGTEAKQAPQTTMAIGDSKSVKLNDSGFFVVGLHLHKGDRFTTKLDEDSASAALHDPKGDEVDRAGEDAFMYAHVDGQYKLVLTGVPGTNVTVTTTPVQVKPLTVGHTVTGHIGSDSSIDLYSVAVKKGEVLNPSVGPPATAEVLDADGATMSGLVTSEDGEQIVAVSWESDGSDGSGDFSPFDYQLTVTSTHPIPITRGSSQLSLAPGQTQTYLVDGQVGDSIDIDSVDGSVYLSAYDSTGTEVDGSPLTDSGPVTIVVQGDSSASEQTPFTLVVGQVTGFLDGTGHVELSATDDIGSEGYQDTLTLPAGVGGSVVVTPPPGIDVTLGVACLPADRYEQNDSVPHVNNAAAGAPELLGVPAMRTAQVCDIEVGLTDASASQVDDSTPVVLLDFHQN